MTRDSNDHSFCSLNCIKSYVLKSFKFKLYSKLMLSIGDIQI